MHAAAPDAGMISLRRSKPAAAAGAAALVALCVLCSPAACRRQQGPTAEAPAPTAAQVAPGAEAAADRLPGPLLPDFRLASGDGRFISRDDVLGKVIIITYETRSTAEVNRRFKTEIGTLARESFGEEGWVGLAVIDASGATALTRPIWEMQLRRNSAAEGVIIYGDWDGRFRDALGAVRDESNVFIVDPAGAVALHLWGRLGDAELERAREVFRKMRRRG